VSGADRAIRGVAGAAVVSLALIAGAVSYSHMKILADRHGEVGWRAHAFPLSVDGIEVVASLVLLADRRVGRRSGWLVWAALSAGTAASMAANIAVGATDPVGRVVAGWPAFALLVAIKLLSGLVDHRGEASGTVRLPGTAIRTTADGGPPSASGPLPAAAAPDADQHVSDGSGTGPASVDIADLLPAARAVQRAVAADGRRLTRGLLAERLREQGITVSNARLSTLRRALMAVPAGGDLAGEGGER
jgi:hypothetical protein